MKQTFPKRLTLYLASAKAEGAASTNVGNDKTDTKAFVYQLLWSSPSHIPWKGDCKPWILEDHNTQPWAQEVINSY